MRKQLSYRLSTVEGEASLIQRVLRPITDGNQATTTNLNRVSSCRQHASDYGLQGSISLTHHASPPPSSPRPPIRQRGGGGFARLAEGESRWRQHRGQDYSMMPQRRVAVIDVGTCNNAY